MSIADKITSIAGHLEDDYTALEQLGVSVEDRNIENIKDMANQIYAKFPKTSYAEGSNITLSNTLKGKLDFEDGIVGYGDTQQNGTPTPDSPVDIEVVRGKNLLDIEVKARGLNSFDYSVIDNNHISMSNPNNAIISFNDNGFTITPITQGDNYTISGMGITNVTIRSDLRKYLIEVKPNTAYTFIMDLNYSVLAGLSSYYSLIDSSYKVTAFGSMGRNSKTIDSNNKRFYEHITTAADTKYLGFRYGNQGSQPFTYSNIMLVEGTYDADTLPTYEPYYTPQIKQLSLGEYEFAKIGNYVDTIEYDVDEDKVYKKANIGKYVFTGASSENWYLATTKTITQVFVTAFEIPNKLVNNTDALCNYFTPNTQGDTEKIVFGGVNSLFLFLAINKTTASTVNELKIWLSTHNTIVYYILNTPTLTEITGTLKDQIKALYYSQSFTGTTIIEIDGQLPLIIKVRALKGN